MQQTSYPRKPVTRKPQITATTPLSTGSQCFGTFTFADGATVHQSGGLVCSQHGRRHCRHHTAAHQAIIAQAASEEAAQAVKCAEAAQPHPNPNAPVIHTFSTTAYGGISQQCALGLHDDCYLLDCGCSCHRPADPIEARERLQAIYGY